MPDGIDTAKVYRFCRAHLIAQPMTKRKKQAQAAVLASRFMHRTIERVLPL
jgi:hypothetical protein